MPVECPAEVAAFVLAWLYHEPTKLELADEPENLEYLMKLKQGVEFLGIEELQSHLNVVIDTVQGVVKREVDDEYSRVELFGNNKRRSKQMVPYQAPIHAPKRRGRPPKKQGESAPVKNKHLVVELKRIVKDDGDDDYEKGDVGAADESLLALKNNDENVDDSTHDSGVGEFPDDANGDSPLAPEVEIKKEVDAEECSTGGGERLSQDQTKATPAKKAPVKKSSTSTSASSTSTTTAAPQKKRKKRKHILTFPPCPIKKREKMLAEREVKREAKSKEVVKCEFCEKSMTRALLRRHNHNVHRYHLWKKKLGKIDDPGKSV